MKKVLRITIITLLIGGYLFFFIKNNFFKKNERSTPDNPIMYQFKDLKGPVQASVVPQRIKTSWTKYDYHSDYGIGILLTDTNAPWLGLVHAFKSFGLPFSVTTNADSAVKHSMVLVYPIISGKYCDPSTLDKIAAYVKKDGTLLATNVLGGDMSLFGFSDAIPTRTNYRIELSDLKSPLLADFIYPEEKEISLGDSTKYKEVIGTYAYVKPLKTPLLTYKNGQACCTQFTYPGGGCTYAIGIDLGEYLTMNYDNRSFEAGREYVNAYEPSGDVLIRLIKNMYEASARHPVFLNTVPQNKKLAVCLTHDIDYTKSIVNAVKYATVEKEKHVKATYFIQTKYIKDWNDDVFYNNNGVKCTQEINKLGMEIASHTVCHSDEFAKFSLGDGTEQYPSYRPFVTSRTNAVGATILGELRISKYLLESADTSIHITSFRPGYLSYPFELPQALAAVGYSYGSDVTADNVLSHLPFQFMYSREYDAEINMFEFPVTIEDEKPPRMDKRVGDAVQVADKIARYGGFMNVLIHTDTLDYKLKFETSLIDSLYNRAWFGTIAEYGNWWKARNSITWTVEDHDIIINCPMEIEDIGLTMPWEWKCTDTSEEVIQTGNQLLIKKCKGQLRLHCVGQKK